jgi:hypothetical protein
LITSYEILGFPLDLAQYPVLQNFDMDNPVEVSKIHLDWESNLIESIDFKEYILLLLAQVIQLSNLGYTLHDNYNNLEYSVEIEIIPALFFVQNKLVQVETNGLRVKIAFDPPKTIYQTSNKFVADVDKFDISIVGRLSQDRHVHTGILVNKINNQELFDWSWE